MQLLETIEDHGAPDTASGIRKVLLVDDESSIVDIFGMMLQSAGYFVKTALSGATGLNLFENGSWDLVITDRQMPQMDGEKFAQEIRELAPETPLILITGLSPDNVRPGLFNAILRKPFSKALFLSAIEKAISERAAAPLRG